MCSAIIFAARDEVRLAVHLDEDANLAVVVDVVADDAFRRRAASALLGLGDSLRAKVLDRLVHVAAGLLERLLALHHAGARAGAKLGDVLRRECCGGSHRFIPAVVETPPDGPAAHEW